MNKPLVTVCVPTIGRTAMLYDALDSLTRQNYTNIEILLLDNASENEGRRILEDFVENDRRARILRCETRVPMFANFNRGIRAARGEYITFLFDDDLFHPALIDRAVDVLTRSPTACFAGSNYTLIDEVGRVIKQSTLVAETAVVPGRQYIDAQLKCSSMIITTPGVVFRRALMNAFPFPEALSVHGGDLVMRLQMAEIMDVALIDEPLISVRVHGRAETARISATQSIVIRTQLLQEYLTAYLKRRPGDRAFVRYLRCRLALVHASVLGWDWLMLGDEVEAEERRLGLSVVPGGAQLATLLAATDRLGLTAARRRSWLAPLVRRFKPVLFTPYK